MDKESITLGAQAMLDLISDSAYNNNVNPVEREAFAEVIKIMQREHGSYHQQVAKAVQRAENGNPLVVDPFSVPNGPDNNRGR